MKDGNRTKEVASTNNLQLPIQRGNDEAIHDQIYFGLKELIDNQVLEPGVFLPPENELASLWNVARGTVRRAVSQLVDEGVLARRPGRGTWVTSFKIRQFLGRLTSFSEDMKSRGLAPKSELIAIESVVPSLSIQQLFGTEGHLAWKLIRRRFANEFAIAIETCYIRASAVDRTFLVSTAEGSLYELYKKIGLNPYRAIQLVEAVNLSQEQAELLDVRAGTAAFKLERITFDRDENVTEVVESYYRGDLYKFQVELRDLG